MKSSEYLRQQLVPVVQQRFGLDRAPDIRIIKGPCLGAGVHFRVGFAGQPCGIECYTIECYTPISLLCKHIKAGGELKLDHNGIVHTVRTKGPLLCLPS